jgi:hypothetical protein
LVALALALVASSCGDEPATGDGDFADEGTRSTALTDPPALDEDGTGVDQFEAPGEFWCLKANPGEAQATLGWSAPQATGVKVFLDGEKLHSGIRGALPFTVPAGDATGIGTTVVFACEPDDSHTVEVRWRIQGSPPAIREATIEKAVGA